MQDAIAAWASISAVGKAAQLTEKHEWLLKTATSSRTADMGVQTVDSLLGINRSTGPEHMDGAQNVEEDERKQRWIEQNGVTTGERSLDISSVGLGMFSSYLHQVYSAIALALIQQQISLICQASLNLAK